ncbi:DUF3783 domain-containing protein [Clostridium estertheticum]|uniref:DUF3783 domain-containing protein n=1 Tax=Clostridium estertheticum TaxID=238834 RepID=UPI0013E98ACB|nr:DUF3783 domain-containing protein [Clostridium estertheticum]MBZ9689589.1 DUF3783 domain-containing protein [Clostridium estertheticum]
MKLINERLILAYGLTDTEKEKLNSILSKQDILPCKVIEKNMGQLTIKEILCSIDAKENNIELPHEKLLLFNNYKDKELYALIDSIKEIKSADTILAAVTPTSIDWTVSFLLQHLMEEREAYRKM